MTQAIINTLNNLEDTLLNNNKVQNPSMDKSGVDFEKVFENKALKSETKTLGDLKSEKPAINTDKLEDFREFLKKATSEANVESSLDLTLARDINEIISQLKDAVEEVSEGEKSNLEENLLTVPETENSTEEDSEVAFEQLIALVERVLPNKTSTLQEGFATLKETDKSLDETVSFEQADIEVLTETSADEITRPDDLLQNLETSLDEEALKELKIESISAETGNSDGESLMQNQTPEEQAVKAMLQQEIESFDIKVEKALNIQNSNNAQPKTADINPSKIIDQITKQLEGLYNNSKVNIVLNPEALGKVNIQLMSTKEGLMAQFTVNTPEARDLLMKGLDGLKDSLLSHGVNVDNVSVKMNEAQKSEYNQDWTEQEGSRGGNKGQSHPEQEEKQKGLFEKMMAQTLNEENGNV